MNHRLVLPICIWIGVGAPAPFTQGQVYLVTGAQTPKTATSFSSDLWQVGGDGNLKHVGEIASKEPGLFWIEISNEARKLVALTRAPASGKESSIVVVDFDEGTIVKRCTVPLPPPNFIGIEEWLADIPGKGLAVVDRLNAFKDVQGKKELVRALSIDPSVTCQASAQMIAPSDSTAIVLNGRAGVAGVAANEPVVFGLEADGRIVRKFREGESVYTGHQIPKSMRSGLESAGHGFSVMIDNLRVVVVVLGGVGADSADRVLALRKSDLTWLSVPNPSDDYPWARSFGSYLAMPEAHIKSPALPKSAGAAEWRNKPNDRGPDMESVFEDSPLAYSGRFYLYDVNTERPTLSI